MIKRTSKKYIYNLLQNNTTWNAVQSEDLKFIMRKCNFTSGSGIVTLQNDNIGDEVTAEDGSTTVYGQRLGSNPIILTNSSTVVRVKHADHGMYTTSNNVTIAGVASGTYNGLAHSDINGTYTSISNVTLDSYDITTAGTATSSGDIGGSTVVATENRAFDVMQLQIGQITQPGTDLSATIKTTITVYGNETGGSQTIPVTITYVQPT